MLDGESSLQVLRDLAVGVLVQGADASIRFANAAALDLLGLTEDELLGRSSFDPTWNVVHHDGSPFPGETHPVPVAIATRKPVTDVVMGVWRPRRKDRAWLTVAAYPRLDAAGAVVDCLCTFSDITLEHERHRIVIDRAEDLERAVAERTAALTETVSQLSREVDERAVAEARFARVTDAVPGVLLELSQRGEGWNTTFASGQAGPVLGLALTDLRRDAGQLFGRLHPDDAAVLLRRLAAGGVDRSILDLQVRVGRDGDWAWARVYAVPERGDGGLRWTAFLTDVTEAHRGRRIG